MAIAWRFLGSYMVYTSRIRRKPGDEGGQILPGDPSVGYRLMPPGP